MTVENLKQKLEELPKNFVVTEVLIKSINRHGEEHTIEYKKSVDELQILKHNSRLSVEDFKFWRRKINLKKQ